MIKRHIFKLLPLFLAIPLAICACDNAAPVSGGSAGGALYYTEGSSGEWVIVGISEPPAAQNRAAFAPKSGYWYVIGIGSETNDGNEPISMGSIQVNGNSLTFFPFSEMGFPAASFTGSLGTGCLIIDRIPGRSYSNLRVEEGAGFNFKSTDDPWGTGGGLPRVPGAPDFGGGGGGDGPQTGAGFNPGKFVTDVVIINSPNVKVAYEGFPVDLSGFKALIRYSNGETAEKTSADADEFIIQPPVYTAANGVHSIRYIAEYNNPAQLRSNSFQRQFRAPKTNESQGIYFYDLMNPGNEIQAEGTANKEYFEGRNTFDLSGVTVKAKYSNGEKTIILSGEYQTVFIKSHSPDDSELRVMVGAKYAVIPIKFNRVYSMRGIQLEGAPSFSAQVLYDDPRFFSRDAEEHWLSKFNGVNIRFLYSNTSATKSSSITELYRNGLTIQFPDNLTEKDPKIIFTYRGETDNFTASCSVPVYNRLTGIKVESTVGKILLKGSGPLYPDNEQSFLRQIKIRAVYQMGSDKTKLVSRDNILLYPPLPANAGVDTTLINSPYLETNVTTGSDGILTKANSKAYDEKNKLVKAKVSFTTTSAGSNPQTTTKSAAIEVGVTGYQY